MSRSNCCTTPISHKSSDVHTPTLPFVAAAPSGAEPTALASPTATSKSSPVSAWRLTSSATTSSGLDPNCDVQRVRLLIAVLPYNNLTNAEAFPNEKQQSWISCIVHALEYFGGTPQVLVMDNAKALVKHSSWYEGEVQQTVRSLCNYYDIEPWA